MSRADDRPNPPVVLSDYTTLGLGGPAKTFVSASLDDTLTAAVRSADAAREPVLVIGGGSNLVIADAGFDGTVIHVNTRGVSYAPVRDAADSVDVTVAAGEDWDDVVAATIAEGLAGLECLSGIPGRVGGTPVQNVGAYGHEVAEVITQVRVYDRQEGQIRIIPNEFCTFAYRTSLFKSGRPESLISWPDGPSGQIPPQPRHVVLDVTFRLARQSLSTPVKYAELAAELGVAMGEQAGADEVRSAVLKIRARKGMVLNPGDPDTRSAGSFFTNPVISAGEFARVETAAAALGAGPVPRFAAGDGFVKVPAAWLIEHSGFAKGYGAPASARVSSKHTLALINAGDATTADLVALAREIVSGVRAAYGVTLTPEPILIGVAL
ncbi:UDP-N-acetylmuramate dehydrogenase [Trebonia kvetii]|uniref:UDP-N-acetylenolpyruvoylglucosamine reductase n=1 Tax=Trebonia kvetii TaxID=2480626 RepID=A0A6P2CAD6_9ACTN|nr:UDP-N-acetylmuramate dehydrogenase [Trebonia kvetii]TVZ07326.1 UDP-N-acetylmuramate dehydrogenase [Trebonia kvetii]